MKAAALIALLLSACAADGAYNDTLPHDTYYSQDAFIGQCGPDTPPQWCVPKLSLCANGSYAYLQGDVIEEGTYHLEGPTAVATSSTGNAFTFDLSSRVMAADGYASPPWNVVMFVGDVDCTYNTP